jgi:hypothetical protein
MCKVLLVILAFCVASYGQIDKYIGTGSDSCPKSLIVRPVLDRDNIHDDIDQDNLAECSRDIALGFSEVCGGSMVIDEDDIADYKKCNSSVIIVKLKKYSKLEAKLGQYQGDITIDALCFKSIRDEKPYKIQEFHAIGDRFWGDANALKEAVKAIVKRVDKKFEQ